MKHAKPRMTSAMAGGALLGCLLACSTEPRDPHSATSPETRSSLPADTPGASSLGPSESAPFGGPSVTLATYNVNFGLAGDAETMAAIRALKTDVVFLQETNEAWQRHLEASLGEAYPHRAFRHCCNAGGLAVLSKLPLVEKDYVHPRGAWFPGWRVVIDGPFGSLQVVNVHLRPNISDGGSVIGGLFTTPRIRKAEIAHYIATLDPTLPAVFVGDFNETAEGLAIGRLNELGMRSALPEMGGTQHTWHWQTSVGKIRKQLDHIVYGEALEVTAARVELVGRSDHYPVVATLRRRAADEFLPK